MIIIVDDEDRENEGDLVCAAEKITPEFINFMAVHGRGLICLPLTEERCDFLQLPPQTTENTSGFGTAFTVSIEAKEGVTTGISAADRAKTILTAVIPIDNANDLARPGHIFPLRAKSGGVLVRVGQTEASVDIARIAGLNPSAVICEIMNDDGTMARMPELEIFAEKHDLKIISVADLVRYRIQKEKLSKESSKPICQPILELFTLSLYENIINGETHLAITLGDVSQTTESVPVRVQTENITFAMFGSKIGEALAMQSSLKKIAEKGCGVILYLRQKEHNLDLIHQLETYKLMQEKDLSFSKRERKPATDDIRDYGIGAQILNDLGVRKIQFLCNHPPKVTAIEAFDLEITEIISL